NQAILNKWLSNDSREEDIFRASLPPIQAEQSPIRLSQPEQVVQLIRILIKKGILTKTEAAMLLNEPVEVDV
ncbi:MAG: hypothetical protein ACRD4Y_02040, partial [Candidatus Acidiferrales bacterium]